MDSQLNLFFVSHHPHNDVTDFGTNTERSVWDRCINHEGLKEPRSTEEEVRIETASGEDRFSQIHFWHARFLDSYPQRGSDPPFAHETLCIVIDFISLLLFYLFANMLTWSQLPICLTDWKRRFCRCHSPITT
jgi:hypothetical protein